MNYDDIIRRFDDIQDLPVSEEMLGAYFEGSLDCHEMEYVSKLIQENDLLQSISEEVMLSSSGPNNDDLSEDNMTGNETVASDGEAGAIAGTCHSQEDLDEDIMEHESYIEDYEYNDSGDFSFDDPSFELPEIPFGNMI